MNLSLDKELAKGVSQQVADCPGTDGNLDCGEHVLPGMRMADRGKISQ